MSGDCTLDGQPPRRAVAALPRHRACGRRSSSTEGGRLLLIGGPPFPERIRRGGTSGTHSGRDHAGPCRLGGAAPVRRGEGVRRPSTRRTNADAICSPESSQLAPRLVANGSTFVTECSCAAVAQPSASSPQPSNQVTRWNSLVLCGDERQFARPGLARDQHVVRGRSASPSTRGARICRPAGRLPRRTPHRKLQRVDAGHVAARPAHS